MLLPGLLAGFFLVCPAMFLPGTGQMVAGSMAPLTSGHLSAIQVSSKSSTATVDSGRADL